MAQLLNNILPLIFLLVVVAIWVAIIAFVYLDTSKKNIIGAERVLWVAVSFIPLVGLLAYFAVHSDKLAFLNPSTQNQQGPATGQGPRITNPVSNHPPPRRTQPVQPDSRTTSPAHQRKPTVPAHQRKATLPAQQRKPTVPAQQAPDATVRPAPNPAPVRKTTPPARPKKRQTAPPSRGQPGTKAPRIAFKLRIDRGPGTISHGTELVSGETLIGVAPQGHADGYVTIANDPSISSTQARIIMTGQQVQLENLSQYGTWINQTHLQNVGDSAPLPPNAEIGIGDTYLRLEKQSTGGAASTPGPARGPQRAPINQARTRHRAGASPSNSGHTYLLRVDEGPHSGDEFFIDQFPATIGRERSCAICLEHDPHVSRKHAKLSLRGQALRLEDLGSRYGVTVNGYHTQSKNLDVGDKIRLGNSLLIFEGQRRR